jgi:hypothetical protein
LATQERFAIRFASGPAGAVIGRVLRRAAGHPPAAHRFRMVHGPVFNNNIGLLVFGEDHHARAVVHRSRWDGTGPALDVVIDAAL